MDHVKQTFVMFYTVKNDHILLVLRIRVPCFMYSSLLKHELAKTRVTDLYTRNEMLITITTQHTRINRKWIDAHCKWDDMFCRAHELVA